MAKTPKSFLTDTDAPDQDTKPQDKPDPTPLSAEEIAKLEQDAVANDANNRKA